MRARWTNGHYKYDTEIMDVGIPAPLNFIIPRLEVIDSIGRLVTVNYSVRLTPKTPLTISKSLSLYIDPQDFDLVEPRLSDDKKTVSVKFLNMPPGYTAKVRWHGVVIRETETKPIQSSSSVAFDIPASWVSENVGKTVIINYTVYRSGSKENLMFSRLLRVTL